MATEREIDEAIARCVSSLVYYVKDRQSLEATRMVEFEIDRVALWMAREGLNPLAEETICRPVLEELAGRFGRKDAQKLSIRFLRPLGKKPLAAVGSLAMLSA